jgi:hypothetical protein
MKTQNHPNNHLTDQNTSLMQKLPLESGDRKKVLQVRYRNPRNSVEIFWAQKVLEISDAFRFIGCRTINTATIEGHGVFRSYVVKLNNITIPTTVLPTIREVDKPEWWDRTQGDAETQMQKFLNDPAAVAIGQRLQPFTASLAEWLGDLSTSEQEKLSSILLTGAPPERERAEDR